MDINTGEIDEETRINAMSTVSRYLGVFEAIQKELRAGKIRKVNGDIFEVGPMLIETEDVVSALIKHRGKRIEFQFLREHN